MIVPQQQLILRVTDTISQHIRSTIAKQTDTESNLITEIQPEQEGEGKEDCFIFTLNEKKYPALLLNLPTIVETQKTFDRKIFYKSGDIGQVMHVFDNEKLREQMKSKQTKLRNGEVYFVNGLTSPAANIIKNRYELTSKSSEIYPVHKVKAVINDIASPWNVQEDKSASGAAASVEPAGSEYLDIITEEIVDFQEWMVAAGAPDSTATLGLMGNMHTSSNGLMGLIYHIEGNEWSSGSKLGPAMVHPEILEGPHEENVFVTR